MSTEIGARIKAWRKAIGLTQAEFARRLGVHIGVLKKYEQGLNIPGGEALAAIAKTGVNMNWLLTGEGDMLVKASSQQLQVIEGEGRKATDDQDIARLLRAIEGTLYAMPDKEAALRLAQELFARAQEVSEQHTLRQAIDDLRAQIARLTGTGV